MVIEDAAAGVEAAKASHIAAIKPGWPLRL